MKPALQLSNAHAYGFAGSAHAGQAAGKDQGTGMRWRSYKTCMFFPLFDCCSQYFRIILGKYTFQYKAVRLSGSQVSEAVFPRKKCTRHVEHKFQQDGSWPRADPNLVGETPHPRRRWRPKSDLPRFCVPPFWACCQATAVAMKPAD